MSPKDALPSQVARLIPLVLALTFLLASCDGGATEPPVPVATVAISGTPVESVLLVGGTVQLAAVARDAGGNVLARPATWSSSDQSIASVSSTGLVTAVTSGVVVISAATGGETGAVGIAVRVAVPVPPAGASAAVTTSLLGGSLSVTVAPGAAPVAALTVGRALILTNDSRILSATAFAIGPAGLSFTTPVNAEVAINLTTIAMAKRAGVRLFHVTTDGDLEGVAGSSMDLARGVVVAPLTSTGTYVALVPGEPAQLVDAEGNSRLVEVGTAVPGIAVIARDAAGNPVPGASIEFSVEGGSGSIVGESVALTDNSGRADLPGDWIAGPAKGTYVLRARVVGTLLNVQFSAVAFAPAVAVRIESAPTAAVSGVALNGAIPVQLVDADGERAEVNGQVTLSLIGGSGTLVGTTQELAVLGNAIFQGQRIEGAGTFRFVASSPGLAPDTTDAITVTQQVAWLALLTQPAGAASGLPFTTQPVIELRDHAGLRVMGGSATVTASAHGGGALFGTRTVTAVDGVATFLDLAVEGAGTLQLNFVADGPVSVLSGELVVAPAPAGVRLLVGVAPVADMNSGQSFGVPITVDLSNRGGADVAAIDVTVSWDPTRFEYVDRSVGPWLDDGGSAATITADESQVAAGFLRFTGSTSGATTASFRVGQPILRTLAAVATVETTIDAVVNAASNAASAAVPVTVLPMTVTVRAP